MSQGTEIRIRIEYLVGDAVIADPSEEHDPNEIIPIVYGANDLKIKSGSHTVDEIQKALMEFLRLSPEVNAYVDGKLVEDKTTRRLRPGERVEFM